MNAGAKDPGTNSTRHTTLDTRHFPATGTVLGFDFGRKRIGVAVGDFETRLAHPLTAIAAVENRARFAAIGQLVAEWRPVLLVVRLPAHADRGEHLVGKVLTRVARGSRRGSIPSPPSASSNLFSRLRKKINCGSSASGNLW